MAQLGKNVAASADIAANGSDLPVGEVVRDHLCHTMHHRLVDRLLWKLVHAYSSHLRTLPLGVVPYGDFFDMKIRWCGNPRVVLVLVVARNMPRLCFDEREARRVEQQ